MTQPVPEKTAVVIVAAGRGARVGCDGGPKQYRMIGTKTVLQHVVDRFCQHAVIGTVVVVVHADDQPLYERAVIPDPKLIPVAIGGATRQESALRGLEALEMVAPHKVLIHDAARPFLDDALITRVIDALETQPAVLPVLPVTDTVKRLDDEGLVAQTVSRAALRSAQTPQGFRYDAIIDAHRAAAQAHVTGLTDDASVAEWAGLDVATVEGQADNIKITTARDMEKAQMATQTTLPDIRVGHGYDTHRLVPGDGVWLCGHFIEHSRQLDGHSDADVGLHALTDALLSTIADGDIGSHFPPTDPKWKDADSQLFLRAALERVRKSGGRVTHMDVTLICEEPKIAPHRDKMRETIAAIGDMDMNRVSVKATTNERIGFLGRGEGIAALATATVVMGERT